jgi:hypothetical protein
MSDKPDEESMPQAPTLQELQAGKGKDFSPSKFMRGRRPELFSDSEIVSELRLTRDVFEYKLETLTSRKQEIEFEHFCRRLAEQEICPNLIPQTGPTGGGDSKADSETYPVAEEISLRWYQGQASEGARERWAFAFSAKRNWQPKVRSDVQGIIKTGRGYSLIYFITNQFVKDKARAQIEDQLKNDYKILVRILDRSWIMKCVFEHERFRLAAETLKLTGYDEPATKRVGPRDSERQSELKQLEEQIEDSTRYKGVQYQLAEDCLEAALLARGLELPRIEVEGRFLRAQRIAEKRNDRQQRLRIVYARAWTAFWWYDGFEELNQLYDEVESLAIDSKEATDLELLANVWTVLYTTVQERKLTAEIANIDARTDALKAQLHRVASDKQRPINALQARTSKILMDLQGALADGMPLDPILKSLNDALIASKRLPEFPVQPLIKIIRELGKYCPENTEYDRLLELVISLTEHRASEGEAGCVLLQRGQQKLQAGKKYDAIRLFGRAQQKLAMHEYRAQWVRALAGCSLAYESAGLLWAARANMLVAANQTLAEHWRHGRIVPQALRCVQRLVWLELQLGRVPHVLTWIDLASLVASRLTLDDNRKQSFMDEREAQDAVLGLLLLKIDFWELKRLEFLPHILENFGLYNSWLTLLYALGHEDYLRSQGVIPENETPESLRALFLKGHTQPAYNDLPEQPQLQDGEKVTLHSFVLGCEVTVQAANNEVSISLAETILGILEALLATSLEGDLLPYRSELTINISPSDFIQGLPQYRTDEVDFDQTINVRHGATIQQRSPDEQKLFGSWLLEFVLRTIPHIAVITDAKSFTRRITREEVSLARAMSLSEVEIAIRNILGTSPKFRLSDWEPQGAAKSFPVQRTVAWNDGLPSRPEEKRLEAPLRPGEGEPPDELFGVDSLKHKDRRVLSLINIPLWDKAEWRGTAYLWHPDVTPTLSLGFGKPELGKQIFKELRTKLGEIDEKEHLRITIVTGVDRKQPSSYNVVITANQNLIKEKQGRQFVFVARINRMVPPNLQNLNSFLQRYKDMHRYFVVPSHFKGAEEQPEMFWDFRIGKRELVVREAWQIGENDPDICAIREGDQPIIPAGVEDPPVKRALESFKQLKRRKAKAARRRNA